MMLASSYFSHRSNVCSLFDGANSGFGWAPTTSAASTSQVKPIDHSARFLSITSSVSKDEDDDLDEFDWPAVSISQPIAEAATVAATTTTSTSTATVDMRPAAPVSLAASTPERVGQSTRFIRIITSVSRGDDESDWSAAGVPTPIAEAPGILATLVTRAIVVIRTLAVRLGISSLCLNSRTRVSVSIPTAPVPGEPTPSALALRYCPSTIVLRPIRAAQIVLERRQEEAELRLVREIRLDLPFRREMALLQQQIRNDELQEELDEIARTPRFSTHRPAAECVARTTSVRQSCSRRRTPTPFAGRIRV